MSDDDFDPCACDPRQLSPHQWAALRKRIVARAQADRTRFIRQIVVGGLRVLWTAWRRMLLRQEARAALRAMSDYELRDIGVTRSDIEGAIRREGDAADERERHRYGVLATTGTLRCDTPDLCRARLYRC